jgi:tRNA(adenine34) deaminase
MEILATDTPPIDWDSHWMALALEEAALAAKQGEVPIGAVICRDNELIAAAHNQREGAKNALAHAEILAIDTACKKLGGWRLHECVLYVTLEPCPMCAGAIINARLRRVIYGAADPKAGCFGSVADFAEMPFNHHPEITAGVRESDCAAILRDFFATLRKRGEKG